MISDSSSSDGSVRGPSWSSYPAVQLRDILSKSQEWISLNPTEIYREVTVKMWGKGVCLRKEILGAEIKSPKRLIVHTGQFILSRIDSRNGAFGLIPNDLNGAVVSNDFPVYTPAPDKILPEYLAWMSRTWDFVELCRRASEGTTNRVRLDESRFLSSRISLPPLPEQRRIVDWIGGLASRVDEAREVTRKSTLEINSLSVTMAHRLDLSADARLAQGWKLTKLGDVIKETNDLHRVEAAKAYPNFGIYSYGRGLFRKSPIEGVATSAAYLRRVRAGQFIYSRLFAFEGAYGRVTPEFDKNFISNEYPTFDCDPKQLNIEFLNAYFRMPAVWKQVAMGSKGLGDRRQRVQPEQILNHKLYVPPLEWQEKIKHVTEQQEKTKPFLDKISAELDALQLSILNRAFMQVI